MYLDVYPFFPFPRSRGAGVVIVMYRVIHDHGGEDIKEVEKPKPNSY